MTPTAIFACDPGLRSGWATWGGDKIRYGEHDPMNTLEELDGWLHAQRQTGETCEVVFEAYLITVATAQKSQQHYSLELIGAARWLCHAAGVPFELQKPSEAKRFCPDQRLRDLGIYASGRADHERDALRHLVMRLAKHRLIRLTPLGSV